MGLKKKIRGASNYSLYRKLCLPSLMISKGKFVRNCSRVCVFKYLCVRAMVRPKTRESNTNVATQARRRPTCILK